MIDADRHTEEEDGVAALAALCEGQDEAMPAHPVIGTDYEGEHHIFRMPDEPIGQGKNKLPPGVDIRGYRHDNDGGYIIAAGSRMPDGRGWGRVKGTPSLRDALPLPPRLACLNCVRRRSRRRAPSQQTTYKPPGRAEEAYAPWPRLIASRPSLPRMKPSTGRDNKLLSVAGTMGRMIGPGWIGQATVEGRLFEACRGNCCGFEVGNAGILDKIKRGIEASDRQAPHPPLPERQRGNGYDEVFDEQEEVSGADLLHGFAFLNEAPAAPQAMLIEGVLPLEGLPFIGGQSSAGKTFIAILMAACAATQQPFFGHEVTERVGSVIVAAEGKAMLRSRILAALKELGVDAETEVPIAWVKEIPDFSNKHSLAAFIKRLQAISDHFKEKFGVRLGLVFVDTVSASFDIEEEADNAEASRVCKIMRRVSEAANASVVPIHHYGKNAAVGLRGASAWRANADIVLSVTADIDSMTGIVSNRQLSMAKDRDGAQGPLTAFMLKPVELGIDDDGKPFGSMVAVASERIQTASQWPEHLRIFRQALSTAIIEHGSVEQPYPDGPQVRAVAEPLVRAEFERIAHVDSPPEKRPEALRKQFSRKLNGAQVKGLIGLLVSPAGHGLVWFASGKEASSSISDTKLTP